MRRSIALLVCCAIALGIGASTASAYIYWQSPDPYRIGRVALDRSDQNGSFITGGYFSGGIASDGNKLYWGNSGNGSQGWIGTANVDGTAVNQNTFGSLTNFGTFATATRAGKLYWLYGISGSASGIARDGSGIVTTSGAGCGIAVDDNYLYWSNGHYIGRSLADGSSPNSTWLNVGANDLPCGVAVTPTHIFWTVHSRNGMQGTSIGRATIGGDPLSVSPNFLTGDLFSGALNVPSGLAVDNKFIYWSNYGPNGTIGRALLDGSDNDPNFVTGVYYPGSLAVDPLGPAQAAPGALPSGENPYLIRVTSAFTSNPTFVVGNSSTSQTGRTSKTRKTPVGTTFSFSLDAAAKVAISFELKKGGRTVNGKCRKPTTKTAKKKKCNLVVGTIARDARAGVNKVKFTGRLKRKALKPGKYQAVFVATGTGGKSKPVNVAFKIVSAAKR